MSLGVPDPSHLPQIMLALQPTSPLSPPDTWQILSYLYQFLYPNSLSLYHFVNIHLQPTPEDLHYLRAITASFKICQVSDPNSSSHSPPFQLTRPKAFSRRLTSNLTLPMPIAKCVRCIGMDGTFPTTTKKGSVSDLLLLEIITHQSDNGLEFISYLSQTLSKSFNIPSYFHTPYHPGSSEKIKGGSSEKIKGTSHSLKHTIVKLSQELHLGWVNILPLSPLRLQAFLKWPLSISPFEPMYRL